MSSSDATIAGIIKIENGNFVLDSFGASILPLGEVKGLGDIVSIPKLSPSRNELVKECAAVQGHGYIIGRGSGGNNNMQYYRLYIDNKKDRFLVKYQTPFLGSETEIIPEQTEFNFDANCAFINIKFKNQTLFPFYCQSIIHGDVKYISWDPPIIEFSSPDDWWHAWNNGAFSDDIYLVLGANETSQPRDTTFLITSPIGNDVSIKIHQAATN
jgi:hypothetical protein